MYGETIDHFAHYATAKRDAVATTPVRFFVASMMAGAYIGLAIIRIYSLGADAAPAYRHLIMGASFGVGLTLVVFAGGELFTGQTMYMTHGLLQHRTGVTDLLRVWSTCWLGNLAGSVLVAVLFAAGGGGGLLFGHESFLFDDAARVADRVLADVALWGEDLTALPGLAAQVTADLLHMTKRGMKAALQHALVTANAAAQDSAATNSPVVHAD
jgi:hypothetical protein